MESRIQDCPGFPYMGRFMGSGTRLEGNMNEIWNHSLIRPTANVTLNLTFCKVGNEQMKVVQRKHGQK